MRDLSRRRFIATGSAGAIAAAAALRPGAVWASTTGLPIGIQLYTVRTLLEKDTPGTLKQLHALGYREVETAGLAKHPVKEFRSMLNDAGLVCPSSHLQMSGSTLDAQFSEAHALGAHYVVTSGFGTETAAAPLDRFKRGAEYLNGLGKKAHAAGLQYAYHNHNFEFVKMPDGSPGYDVLLKETDPALVKFEIDCGWMVIAGSKPVEYFHRFPGRFRMLHIKDFKPVSEPLTRSKGQPEPVGADLGTGFIDYRPIFAATKATGIEHIFMEQEDPFPVSPIDSAKNDYAYLQKFS
jgi:sugar phosphate isomerase/epimerase